MPWRRHRVAQAGFGNLSLDHVGGLLRGLRSNRLTQGRDQGDPSKADPNRPAQGRDQGGPSKAEHNRPAQGRDQGAPGKADPSGPGQAQDQGVPSKAEPNRPAQGRDQRVPGKVDPNRPAEGRPPAAPGKPESNRQAAVCPDGALLGRVMSVAGAIIWALLDPGAASSAEIGHVVRLQGATGRSFGVITTLKNDGRRGGDDDRRLVEIRLIGEILTSSSNRWRFQRGVSSYPPLDSPIHAGTREELCAIYARPEVSTVRLGTLRNAADLPAFAMTDNLLGKHFAVLGTTGAGKSCAVTVILRAILDACPFGHIIMLDPHNEYATAFQKRCELLNPSNLKLPYWLLNFEEISAILVNQELPEGAYAEGAILRRAILKARRNFSGEGASQDHVTVDTPVPYRLSELIQILKDDMGAFNKADSAVFYQHLINRVESVSSDKRYDFMFSSFSVRDNMRQILSRILRIPVEGKPLTIIDISGVPSERPLRKAAWRGR